MMPYGLFRKWRRSHQLKTKSPEGQVRSVIRLQVEQLEPRELLSATTASALTGTLASAGALASEDTSTPNLLALLGAAPTSLSPATAGLMGPSGPSAASPTGRSPRLLWTPQQQAVWNQMVQQNSPWWQLIQHNAQHTPFADHGAWATLAYQMTGDPTYAGQAWSLIEPLISHDPKNGNILRQNLEQLAISFDWLLPALTPVQRQKYVNGLNRWSTWALSDFRLGDTDQTISQYFGLAMVDIATQGYSRMAGTWLNQTATGRLAIPMGGLVATAADRSTARNAIAQYVQMAAGGVWVESSQYNLNTLQLLTLGVEAIDSATGQDYFPEVTQFLKQAALAEMYEMAPTLTASYQWGDNEHPRGTQLPKRMGLLGMLAGVTQNDPSVGPYINQFVQNLVNKLGYQGWQSAAPMYPWMFYVYNPNAAKADWTQALPAGYFASGRGTLYFHNGWSANSSFFGAQFMPPSNADHQISAFGDFQLYSQGGWAVTHPIGYGSTADSGLAGNDMLIAGFSSMQDRHVDAQQFGPNGSYAYVSGTTKGSNYAGGYYNPPPAFLQEWTRSLFYLPSANGGPDTVIVFDRVNATDPRNLPGFDRYTTADQQTIESA
ncbi:MAG TPA: hypothetical protein VFA18_01270, partial [Gemmataceae bacterium]|nr:hypothetical protein [Gemmataceae bacterium]